MTERSFLDDWKFDIKMGRMISLKDWEIQSVRIYRSKKGVKAHVIFKLKEDVEGINKKEKLQKLMEFENALSDLIKEMLPLSELTEKEIREFFGDKTLTEYILDVMREVEGWGVIE